jgi:hypothetical protein
MHASFFSSRNYNKGLINYDSYQGDILKMVAKFFRGSAIGDREKTKFIHFNNELGAYEKLSKAKKFDPTIDWFPEIIAVDRENYTLYLQYVGEPLNQNNIPRDYKEQISKIFKDLKSLNMRIHDCYYYDVTRIGKLKIEFTVMDGKIYLVDLGENPNYINLGYLEIKDKPFTDEEIYSNFLSILETIYDFKIYPRMWIPRRQYWQNNQLLIYTDPSFELENVGINFLNLKNNEFNIKLDRKIEDCSKLLCEYAEWNPNSKTKNLMKTLVINFNNQEVFNKELHLQITYKNDQKSKVLFQKIL